jgi:hypothetical protein
MCGMDFSYFLIDATRARVVRVAIDNLPKFMRAVAEVQSSNTSSIPKKLKYYI